jgi:hypothetical protein
MRKRRTIREYSNLISPSVPSLRTGGMARKKCVIRAVRREILRYGSLRGWG